MYNHDPTYLFQTGGYCVNESDTATVHNLHESNNSEESKHTIDQTMKGFDVTSNKNLMHTLNISADKEQKEEKLNKRLGMTKEILYNFSFKKVLKNQNDDVQNVIKENLPKRSNTMRKSNDMSSGLTNHQEKIKINILKLFVKSSFETTICKNSQEKRHRV